MKNLNRGQKCRTPKGPGEGYFSKIFKNAISVSSNTGKRMDTREKLERQDGVCRHY